MGLEYLDTSFIWNLIYGTLCDVGYVIATSLLSSVSSFSKLLI